VYLVHYSTPKRGKKLARFQSTEELEKRLMYLCGKRMDATVTDEQERVIGYVYGDSNQWSYKP